MSRLRWDSQNITLENTLGKITGLEPIDKVKSHPLYTVGNIDFLTNQVYSFFVGMLMDFEVYGRETIEEVIARCDAAEEARTNKDLRQYGKCLSEGRLNPQSVESKICADFGMSQIYYKTANSFGFNINKLTTDLEYSVEAGAIVLADFRKRYANRELDWWTRYNASSRTKRNIYKQLVERYL